MTLLVTGYKSKKELNEAIGKKLVYRETSMFGTEYKSDGKVSVAYRPSIAHIGEESCGREFFAEVTMKNNLIEKVS
jgi:hypothetical protein